MGLIRLISRALNSIKKIMYDTSSSPEAKIKAAIKILEQDIEKEKGTRNKEQGLTKKRDAKHQIH